MVLRMAQAEKNGIGIDEGEWFAEMNLVVQAFRLAVAFESNSHLKSAAEPFWRHYIGLPAAGDPVAEQGKRVVQRNARKQVSGGKFTMFFGLNKIMVIFATDFCDRMAEIQAASMGFKVLHHGFDELEHAAHAIVVAVIRVAEGRGSKQDIDLLMIVLSRDQQLLVHKFHKSGVFM